MKRNKLATVITSLTFLLLIWFANTYDNRADGLKGFDLYFLIFIIIIGSIAFIKVFKRYKEEKHGIPEDDELSTKIKFKAGYYANLISMYMWLLLYLLKERFHNVETIFLCGLLLSALISYGTRYVVKRNFNE